MGILGYIHVVFGILALVSGLVIFRVIKGTQLHRILGYLYVANMLGLNVTGLMIYRVFGTFGPFHVLAVISLLTLVAGFVPVYFKRPAGKWLQRHYEGMCWSYVGLLAATAAEITVRLPFIHGFGMAFGIATFVSSFIVVFIGAYVLYRYRDQTLAGLQPPISAPNKALLPTGASISVTPDSTSPEVDPAAER